MLAFQFDDVREPSNVFEGKKDFEKNLKKLLTSSVRYVKLIKLTHERQPGSKCRMHSDIVNIDN